MIIPASDWTFARYQSGEYGDHCIIHGDCRDVLPKIPDKAIDLVLTDPPYGILGGSKSIGGSKIVDVNEYDLSWDIRLSSDDIDRIFSKSTSQIWWGGNYYSDILPLTKSWLIWDKKVQNGWEDNFSDGEMAWSSLSQPLRIYRHLWMGCLRRNGHTRLHPTEKPVDLMNWCLSFAPKALLILDPFLGSGTTLVAAKNLGRRAIGIEINYDYCKISERRLAQEVLKL